MTSSSTVTSVCGSSCHSVGAVTSVTTITTTTSTAVIGSNACNGSLSSCEMHESGTLLVKPLIVGAAHIPEGSLTNDHHEDSQTSPFEDKKQNQAASSPLSASVCAMLFHSYSSSSSSNNSSPESCSESENAFHPARKVNSINGYRPKNLPMTNTKSSQAARFSKTDTESPTSRSTPSPDVVTNNADKSDPLYRTIEDSNSAHLLRYGVNSPHVDASIGPGEIEGMWPGPSQVVGWNSWCPQHSLAGRMVHSPTVPIHIPTMWPHTPPLAMSHSSPVKSVCSNRSLVTQETTSPQSDSSGSPTMSTFLNKSTPPKLRNTLSSLKIDGSPEDLFGKPILKVDPPPIGLGATPTPPPPQHMKPPFGMMTPTSPVMVVPWYHCAPVISPPWCQWPSPHPLMVHYPQSQSSPPSYCSSHTPTCTSPSPILSYPSPGTAQNHISEASLQPTFSWPMIPKGSSSSSSVHNPMASSHCHSNHAAAKKLSATATSCCSESRQATWKGGLQQQQQQQHRIPQRASESPPTNTYPISNIHRRNIPPYVHDSAAKDLCRVTQLPDDRYALLPISPPPTPLLQFDVANCSNVSSVSLNHSAAN